MLADHHVFEFQQRVVERRRFAGPDVEAGAGEVAATERVREGGFVVDAAAGGGDEQSVRLHQRERARVEHALGFPGARAVH